MKRTNTAKWNEKEKRWRVVVQKDGIRKAFYSSIPGRTGQREANAKADAWLDNNIDNSSSKVQELFNQYTNLILSSEEKEKAERIGRLYICPAIGHKKICSIKEGDFQTILDKAAIKGANGQPLSKKTLTTIRSIMKNFIKYCRKQKVTTETLEFLEIPKNAHKKKKRILQPEDLITLFTSDETIIRGKRVPDEYIHAYRFAVLTGLRPGELIGLERQDIDGHSILMKRSINEKGIITTGKNENACRRVVLTDIAYQELQYQLSQSDDVRVFSIESQSTYRHRWQRYCEANNIPYISPYELRHTFVSMARGLSDGEVRSIVGHSRNMDTWGIYGHDVSGDKERIATKLQSIFIDLISPKSVQK